MAAAAGTLGGVLLSSEDARLRSKVLPSTGLRTCCDAQPLSEAQRALPSKLQKLVGREHVSTSVTLKGSRLGQGTAMAVVKPGSISEAIAVLEACVAADVAVLPQGANTGLTGGSVPRDDASDRPNVVINMRRLNKILPLGADGHQVLCFGGAGIFDLQEKLKNEYNRDSHSVLGSIFLNPSVAAGVSFGSGGTQIRKGPAFTERALFCRVTADSKVELVDTLGLTCQGRGSVALLDEATGSIASSEVDPAATRRPASWPKYAESLMKLDAQVSRFNADTRGLDCNRSEGKVMILATVHDTFPFPVRSRLAWASCRDFTTAQALKREVGISSSTCMAKSCEYMNRETYDTVDQAGRILIKMIEVVGMRNLEPLWNLKLFIESLPIPLATIICDKFLWWFNNILPKSLPAELEELAKEFDHHVLMEFAEYSNGEVDSLVERLKRFQASRPEGDVKFHFCDDDFGKTRATLFRFAVAPAFRTLAIGKGQQGLSIDYALPKNFAEIPTLPEDKYPIQTRLIYSHFGCNVYHEDFVFGNDIDVHAAKKAIKKAVESIGGKLPAEHGHGTEYAAPEDTKARWMKTDPSNVMNPGVGGTSFKKNYAPCDCCHSH
eukprot:TRINITY_DN21021_c0_g1_i1.p1 TRINITY_DN21021_c0_g1~~TRINITY_DN21021_c0_g1_i1.p1  ORF type:complete len:660 (+),score=124.30 TRINITY_DN21021_c0_g1_i1:159-1982(+)